MVTRFTLVLLAIVLFVAGLLAAAVTIIELDQLGASHRTAIVIGVANGFMAWALAFVCAVLAGVHDRVDELARDVAYLEEDLTTSDGVGTLGG